jgi:hypothetical protein
MQNKTLTEETWMDAAKEAGVGFEMIAYSTGKSWSTVYSYSRGKRHPSDAWLAQVTAIVAAEAARRNAA